MISFRGQWLGWYHVKSCSLPNKFLPHFTEVINWFSWNLACTLGCHSIEKIWSQVWLSPSYPPGVGKLWPMQTPKLIKTNNLKTIKKFEIQLHTYGNKMLRSIILILWVNSRPRCDIPPKNLRRPSGLFGLSHPKKTNKPGFFGLN